MAIQWKAVFLGAASGIALTQLTTTVFPQLLMMAMDGLHPITIGNTKLAFGFLSAGIGGGIAGGIAKSDPITQGLFSGVVQALMYFATSAALVGLFLAFHPMGYAIAILTVVSGAAGGFLSKHMLSARGSDSSHDKRSNS